MEPRIPEEDTSSDVPSPTRASFEFYVLVRPLVAALVQNLCRVEQRRGLSAIEVSNRQLVGSHFLALFRCAVLIQVIVRGQHGNLFVAPSFERFVKAFDIAAFDEDPAEPSKVMVDAL